MRPVVRQPFHHFLQMALISSWKYIPAAIGIAIANADQSLFQTIHIAVKMHHGVLEARITVSVHNGYKCQSIANNIAGYKYMIPNII